MDRWKQIEELFERALEQPPAERDAWLLAACGSDSNLFREVKSLLTNHRDGVQSQPWAAEAAAQLIGSPPSLEPGQTLGPYRITSFIAAGGMGAVYRAHDPRTGRDVAVKVAAQRFNERFSREVRAVAALNHPNICTLFDVGPNYLVMELVEGESPKGPLPVETALNYARQIADALEAAHEKGIVHRDLKPGNIKIKPDGTVKVLDFGLAQVAGPSTAPSADSPTLMTMQPTDAGVILGTTAYMSPEQARGQTVDARTDIWAFGCVLYEMLTARPVFDGQTTTDIIAKIVERQPDWGLLPESTPSSIRMLLAAALTKDRHQRLQHIGDARLFLNIPEVQKASAARARTDWRGRLTTVFALAFFVFVFAALYFLRTPEEKTPVRFETLVPGIQNNSFSISPDGQHVAYVATVEGKTAIWIRPIGSVKGQPLSGTENALPLTFWSPDSRFIAFFKDGNLEKINLGGGTPIVVAQASVPAPVSWNRDGTILFSKPTGTGLAGLGIVRVSELGGEVIEVTNPDRAAVHVAPQFLPDGRHFLYWAPGALGPRNTAQEGVVYAGELGSKDTKRIMNVGPDDIPPVYVAPGYLLFGRNGTVMAQRFDTKNLALSGEPIPFLEQIGSNGNISVSDNGVLVYRATPIATPAATNRLVWIDRSGKEVSQVGMPGEYRDLRLSPDEHRIVVDKTDRGNLDVWVLDLDPPNSTRITFDPSLDIGAVWNSDSSQVGFGSDRGGTRKLYRHASSGAGTDEVIYAGESGNERNTTTDWSRDGRYIIFSHSSTGQLNVWVLPLFGDRKAFPFLPEGAPFRRGEGRLSPDGRWLAFTTNEFGRNEIIVQSFPNPDGGRWQVSVNGGIDPLWRHDGKELYYVDLDGKLIAVSIQGGTALGNGPPTMLFQTPLSTQGVPSSTRFDATADGRRFLMIVPVAATSESPANAADAIPITTIVNWTALLRKK